MKFQVIFEPSGDGGYTVYVLELPGCISQGDTKDEALANIKEAMELYLETLSKEELKSVPRSVEILTAVV